MDPKRSLPTHEHDAVVYRRVLTACIPSSLRKLLKRWPKRATRRREWQPIPYIRQVGARVEGDMQEIIQDILTWSWLSDRHGYDFNGHFVCHPEGKCVS